MIKKFALFDFDGVIANTEESNSRYLEKALSSFGVFLTEKDKKALIGTSDKTIVAKLLLRAPYPVTMTELAERRREIGNTYENGRIEPMPYLVEFICSLRKRGLRTAIVTSTSTRLIISALNRMKMMNLFDVIVCGDMCEKAKPDPEIYRKAMSFLNAKPEECVIVEDSTVGIHAGKSAGAYVIAYTGSGIDQDISEADEALDSYKKYEALIERVF